jgi:DNA-binding response OmpR family regulator
MRKILLCLEDYNELLFVETLLKKIGFDVDSVRNEFTLAEKLLAQSPDLVIATGDGLKINGQRVSKKVKRKGLHAKLLLLFTREKMLSENVLDGMLADAALETPLNPRRVLTAICQLTGADVDAVIAKFDKLPIGKNLDKNDPQSSSVKKSGREEKYLEFLKNVPPSKQEMFSKKAVHDELKEIQKFEQEQNNLDLENKRKEFVTSLFKKK